MRCSCCHNQSDFRAHFFRFHRLAYLAFYCKTCNHYSDVLNLMEKLEQRARYYTTDTLREIVDAKNDPMRRYALKELLNRNKETFQVTVVNRGEYYSRKMFLSDAIEKVKPVVTL